MKTAPYLSRNVFEFLSGYHFFLVRTISAFFLPRSRFTFCHSRTQIIAIHIHPLDRYRLNIVHRVLRHIEISITSLNPAGHVTISRSSHFLYTVTRCRKSCTCSVCIGDIKASFRHRINFTTTITSANIALKDAYGNLIHKCITSCLPVVMAMNVQRVTKLIKTVLNSTDLYLNIFLKCLR